MQPTNHIPKLQPQNPRPYPWHPTYTVVDPCFCNRYCKQEGEAIPPMHPSWRNARYGNVIFISLCTVIGI